MNAEKIEKIIVRAKNTRNGSGAFYCTTEDEFVSKAIETALQQEAKARFGKSKKLEFVPCDEHSQEVKPLTVEDLYKIADTAFALKYEQTKGINLALFDAVTAIHAALPPESERIRKLGATVERYANETTQVLRQKQDLQLKITNAIEVLEKTHRDFCDYLEAKQKALEILKAQK